MQINNWTTLYLMPVFQVGNKVSCVIYGKYGLVLLKFIVIN